MTPISESEILMKAVLPVAERMLKQHGEFYPYGGCMRLDGSITHIGATDAETDRPKSGDLLVVLNDSIKEIASRGECKAVAAVFEVSIMLPNSVEKGEAIQVNIEHAGGYSVELFFPYRLADGELIYGETLAQQGKHEVFGTT